MFTKNSVLGFITLFAAQTAVASSQIVICTDKDGHKEYAQKCPEGIEQKPVKIYTGVSGAASVDPSIAEQEAAFRERQLERDRAEKDKAAAEEKAKADKVACAKAQDNLDKLNSGRRARYSDGRGYLDDNDRAREIQKNQANVTKHCS